MSCYFNLRISIFLVACLIKTQVNAKDVKPDSFSEMPKSCQQISPEAMIFELPLSVQKLTLEQKNKIQAIIEDTRTQACILQMQYDGLLQQVIAVLFEGNDVTEEQLKPFYDRLVSLSQNSTENKLKAILSIRKLLPDKEWQDLRSVYTHNVTIKHEFLKQQTELQQSFDALISGNNPSEFTTLPLMSQSFCIEQNPKIQMITQIISTLSLTNAQEGLFRNIMRLQERQFCTIKQEIPLLVEKILKLSMQQPDKIHIKQYQTIFNQLATKAYLQETYQIQALGSLFSILTPEQKNQLREKCMLLKGVL